MLRYLLLMLAIALTASCSSKRVVPKPAGGPAIGELRALCKQGNASACQRVSMNDSML